MDSSILKSDISEQLKRVRSRLGVTQEVFCASVNMPLPSYREYELSKRIPGGKAIKTLMDAGISAHWLLTGNGHMLLTDDPAMKKQVKDIMPSTLIIIANDKVYQYQRSDHE